MRRVSGRGLSFLVLCARLVHAEPPEREVLVVGPSREAEPASTNTVTHREVQSIPVRSAEDALRAVPGVTLIQHSSEGKGLQFFVRGFDAGHGSDFALSVEGLPLNEWSNVHANGYVDLNFVIPELIRAVTVKKGPFSLSQGAFATAGSADYQLGAAADERGLAVGYTIGSTNRQRLLLSYSPKGGDGNSFVAAEALHDDGFGASRATRKATAIGKWVFEISDKHRLALLASASSSAFQSAGVLRNEDVEGGKVGFYDTYDSAQGGRSTRGIVGLQSQIGERDEGIRTRIFGSFRDLALVDNFTGFLLDPVQGDRRRQAQTTGGVGADIEGRARLTRQVVLVMGTGATLERLSQSEVRLGQTLEPVGAARQLKALQLLAHARMGVEWQPLDTVRVHGGIRGDGASVAADQEGSAESDGLLAAVLPRLGVEWAVNETWTLISAYGRGFRPPEARAFLGLPPATAGITEERAESAAPRMTLVDTAELGTRFRPSRWVGMAFTSFAALVEREAVYDHVSGSNLELNGTRRVGMELDVDTRPIDWLLLGADATLVDARFVDSGNAVPFVPWLTFGARVLVTHDLGWQGGLRFTGWAPRPLPYDARGSTYALLSATVGYHLRRLHIDLALENLLDLALREGEYAFGSSWDRTKRSTALPALHYAPAPPRMARLSVTGYF